jgi:pimeloyl-ACP methyl ester carboxylesterase
MEWPRGRKVMLGLALPLLALLIAGRRAITKTKTGRELRDPPPGQLVDLDGYRLHLHCQGAGSPAVILEAGFASLGLIWSEIQAELARFTRVCVYDRAGLGWSDPSPHPRTAQVMVAELHTLLERAGVSGPFLLVGNSLGGLLVRHFAYTYPGEVAGMVLVDAAHEEQFQRLPGSNNPLAGALFKLLPALVRSGIPALLPGLVPVPAQMPEEAARIYRALAVSQARFARTAAAEYAGLAETHAQVRAARWAGLPDIPLVVISHGRFDGLAARLGLVSAAKQTRAEQVWLQLQNELAALSPQGRLEIARQSGHNVEFEQPGLVSAAIQEVLAAARRRGEV